MVRALIAPLVWWTTLFWTWLLLAGEWNHVQLVAAALAASLAAALAEAARRLARPAPGVARGVLVRSWTLPWEVLVDFGVLCWALVQSLVRRRVVRGSFHRRRGAGERPGWVMFLATVSPNAYVVEVEEDGTSLVHDLVTRRASEEPA